MRFHDFHLSGYSVSKFGGEIVLDLVSEDSRETSKVRFSGVAAYHFVHAGSAIITDITEVPVPQLLKTIGDELAEWERTLGGLPHWNNDRAKYAATLQENGYKAWTIVSAIGFEGFIIAECVEAG